MKKLVIASVSVALLVFSGCSKDPKVIDSATNSSGSSKNQVEEVKVVETEIIESDNALVGSENTISSMEKSLSSVYFAFDKFNIDSTMETKVSKSAKIVNGIASAYNVKLEGNCDEWGSDEYNFALGLKRANAVKKSLISEGVDANRISMVSFGESNPTCTDKTRDCWSANRRVDYKLLP